MGRLISWENVFRILRVKENRRGSAIGIGNVALIRNI